MDYEDQIFKWINEKMQRGVHIEIKSLTNDTEKFTKAVKFLMDCRYIIDVSFTKDFTCIYKTTF